MELIGWLVAAALMVKLGPLIVAAVGVVIVVRWVRRAVARHAERIEAQRRRLAGLATRADQQHTWVLADDLRGTCGEYPPAAM